MATNTTNTLDCEVFDLLRKIRGCWRESERLDEKPTSPTYAASSARAEELTSEACDLEWRLFAFTPAQSVEGFIERAKEMRALEWSKEEWAMIAYRWGRDAERLGIDWSPSLLDFSDFPLAAGKAPTDAVDNVAAV